VVWLLSGVVVDVLGAGIVAEVRGAVGVDHFNLPSGCVVAIFGTVAPFVDRGFDESIGVILGASSGVV
jgi:hypothetical protein